MRNAAAAAQVCRKKYELHEFVSFALRDTWAKLVVSTWAKNYLSTSRRAT